MSSAARDLEFNVDPDRPMMVDSRPLIAHVIYRFDVGGLENGVVNLLNRLPRERYRHAVIALTAVTDFRRRVLRDDVSYFALDKQPGPGIRLAPRLARLFRRLRPAIVHTRNLAALEATLPAWWAGVPARVHSEHGWDVDDLSGGNRRNRWTRRLYRPLVSHYIALSQHLMRYLDEQIGVRGDRVSHICNGVDTERFAPGAGARALPGGCPFGDGVSEQPWLVGTVGRLAAVKDQVTLARAFVRALALEPAARASLRLVIVGSGPLEESVREVLRAGGALDLAWLAGERGDIPDILRALDVFALPSLAEGISNTILEAMASGVPVVATGVGGNPELVDAGETGVLVPAGDPEALAGALLDYWRDRARACKHGARGRAQALARFSIDRMVIDYTAVYERLLARGAALRAMTSMRPPTVHAPLSVMPVPPANPPRSPSPGTPGER